MATDKYNFEPTSQSRTQLSYPLDPVSTVAIADSVGIIVRALNRNQALTIPSGATSFAVSSDLMTLTGAAAVTINTILNGYDGQLLRLIFTDANITITDTSTGAENTVNLSAAFTSTANDVITLVRNGTSWYEVARSIN